MNWNDYEAVWKRQELPLGVHADLTLLRETFETKSRKMAATLFLRDVTEAVAGAIGTLAFVFIWWKQGWSGWPIGIAIMLVLGVTGFFFRERFRAHRQRLGSDAPLLAKLEADLAELRHQRRLLLTIWQWYLAPLGVAIMIVRLTIAHHRPYVDWVLLSAYFVFCAVLCIGVWAMNRRAVRKRIEPRLAELEKLRSDILSP